MHLVIQAKNIFFSCEPLKYKNKLRTERERKQDMELTQTPTIIFSEELASIGGVPYLRAPFFSISPNGGFPASLQFVINCNIPSVQAEIGETLEIQIEFVNKSTGEKLFASDKIPFEVNEPVNGLTLNFDKIVVPIAQADIYEARLSINGNVIATNELSAREPRKLA